MLSAGTARSLGAAAAIAIAVGALGAAVPAAASPPTWSGPIPIGTGFAVVSVSCVSSTFCMAVDAHGDAIAYDGASWATSNIDGGTSFDAVSCATSTFCMAVDDFNTIFVYNGSSWAPSYTDSSTSGIITVSCVNPTFCVATDGVDNELTYDGSSWTASSSPIDGAGTIQSVSCVSPAFCLAVDTAGDWLAYDGSTWTTPVNIDSHVLAAVSCVTATFCVATDAHGAAYLYNGSTWSSSAIDGSHRINSVSCPAVTFCMAVDSRGNALAYNGASWASASIDGSAGVLSVSCPGTTFCVAVDNNSNALIYSGSPGPPGPGSYGLSRFITPRHGSHWRAGSVIPIATNVTYSVGLPIPSSLAASLAAGCDITVSASGSQRLRRHCMSYDDRAQRFTYRWKTGTHRTGTVKLEIQLSFPSPSALQERIIINRRAAGTRHHPSRR